MALNGTITKSITGRKYVIEWSAEQSVANNTSTITCVHKLVNDATYSLKIYSRSNTCTVGGEQKNYTSPDINTSGGSTITLGTTKHTVSHDSDGKKSVTISGTFNIQATLSGSYVSSLTASSTVTLDTIPRSSSLSISTTSLNVGGTITASITRASSSFTHDVEFYINSTYYKKYTGVATSQAFVIPTSWYNAMPTSSSCTAYCRITTYNNGTQIGSQASKSFTVNVPANIKPSLGTISLDPVNITTADGVSRNMLVKGKNKITVSVSGCKAGDGSGIKSYTFAVLSGSTVIATTTTTSTSVSLGPFSQVGALKFRLSVTDNRGRTADNNGGEPTWECYDYEAPYFSVFNAYRANSDGSENVNGTYLKCDYTSKYWPVNSTNNISVKVNYGGQISDSTLINLGEDSATYQVYLTITDNYGGSNKSSIVTVFGQSRIINITSDGTGVAIGKMAESKELLECRWPAKFNDDCLVGGNLTIGASTQSITPTTGIAVHDVRDADIAPDSFGDKNANFYFDQISNNWYSILHMKGWTGNYAAWELAGNAHNSSNDNTLKYRQGLGDTWGDWQTVITDKNIKNYANTSGYLPSSGGTLTGKLTLANDLYNSSNTAGLDCRNSDIIGANGIFFNDVSDSADEGMHFYRSDGYWDTLYAKNGVLKFHPNKSTSTALGGYTIYNSSNFRRGTCTLSSSSDTIINFTSALGGTPTVLLTPLTDTAGVIPGKVKSASSTGFTAIIGGSAVSSAKFAYLAIYF